MTTGSSATIQNGRDITQPPKLSGNSLNLTGRGSRHRPCKFSKALYGRGIKKHTSMSEIPVSGNRRNTLSGEYASNDRKPLSATTNGLLSLRSEHCSKASIGELLRLCGYTQRQGAGCRSWLICGWTNADREHKSTAKRVGGVR